MSPAVLPREVGTGLGGGAVQGAILASAQFAAQTALHQTREVVFQGRDADFSDDLGGKRVHKQTARRSLRDAAAPHVEQRLFVQLPHRGAMAALDIVGVDFQIGFGLELGLFGQQQVAVGLIGLGFLRAGFHEHMALEAAGGAVVQNAFEKLAAARLRALMVDLDPVADLLVAIDH